MTEKNGKGNGDSTGFRGFSREAWVLILFGIFEAGGNVVIWFLFPLYLGVLEFTKPEIGFVLLVQGTSMTLPLIPCGYLGDRFGRKRMVILGTLLKVLGIFTITQARTLTLFFLGAMIWGLANATSGPAFYALLAEKESSEAKRKYLFAMQMFSVMAVSGFSTLVAGFLPGYINVSLMYALESGFRATFWFGMGFVLVSIPIIIPVTEKEKPGTADRLRRRRIKEGPTSHPVEGPTSTTSCEIPQKKKAMTPIPWKTIALLCFPMALLGLGAGLIVPFFQLYFVWRFEASVDIIGILFALTQFLWAIGYLVMPKLADATGSVRAITLTQSIAIMALIAIPVSGNFYIVAAMYTTRMVLMNASWPILSSYSINVVGEEHGSTCLSATRFSFDGLKGLTPGIAGFIYEWDLELPFFICAAFYAVATVIFFGTFRNKDDKVKDNKRDRSLKKPDSEE
jgi:MFS family permease